MHDPFETFMKGYRKLLEDYFPTSRHSSTPVKLASCLTEVVSLWSADGAAVLTGAMGSKSLTVEAGCGESIRTGQKVTVKDGSLSYKCFIRGKEVLVEDLGAEQEQPFPWTKGGSSAFVPINSSGAPIGILVIWSEEKNHFKSEDLLMLSLFSYYLAMLLESDELEEKLGQNLLYDPLTGLHNVKQFEHRLYQEVQRSLRYSLTLSLLILEVDNLSDYVEASGHMLGNLAISDIARMLDSCTRQVDFVSRTGTSEFAIILPETGRLGALRLADRLRSQITSYPFPVPENHEPIKLDPCIGIASLAGKDETDSELFSNAYQALEKARYKGPGNVFLWEKEESKEEDSR